MARTVFIVGAGASAEFGLPLGSDLAERIRVLLNDEVQPDYSGPLRRTWLDSSIGGNFNNAANDLRGALLTYPSIDRALHARRDDNLITYIGKLSIAALLTEAETGCDLAGCSAVNRQATHSALSSHRSTWIFNLLHQLVGPRRPSEMGDVFKDIAFVVFNYDRVIEQAIAYLLIEAYGLEPEHAQDLVMGAAIEHAYGALGPFTLGEARSPWTFGAKDPLLGEVAAGIRTFTQGASDGSREAIQKLMGGAENLVFLGFGFDPLNCELLRPEGIKRSQRMWATCAKMHHRHQTAAQDWASIREYNVPDAVFSADECARFVTEYAPDFITR